MSTAVRQWCPECQKYTQTITEDMRDRCAECPEEPDDDYDWYDFDAETDDED